MKLARRTLGISRKQLYTLKDEYGQITFNRDKMIKVMGKFYRKLYSNNDRQTEDPSMEAIKEMSSSKAGDADDVLIDLIKDADNFLQDKLTIPLTKVC